MKEMQRVRLAPRKRGAQHTHCQCQDGQGQPEVQDHCDFEHEHPTNRQNTCHKGAQPMNISTLSPKTNIRKAFTLIEILIVVVILGILAAVVVPQFTNASEDANDAAVRTQLQTLRGQIELYRMQIGSDPTLIGDDGWSQLIENDYLMIAPMNPLTSSSSVKATPDAGTGWVWRAKSETNTTKALFAVNAAGTEFSE